MRTQVTITIKDIQDFADLSGDHNPIHLDDKAAQQAGFNERIAHGHLVGSIVSQALAEKYPGCILCEETRRFLAPVYPGDTVEVVFPSSTTETVRRRVTVVFEVQNQFNKVVISGSAEIKLPKTD
jgi:3-hydroxybutyryl-CoA dehydratase